MSEPALEALRRKLAAGRALVAGVISGTSADGIDVALARPAADDASEEPRTPELLAFELVPFPDELRGRVRRVLDGGADSRWTLAELAVLHRDLGLAFGRAARTVADSAGHALDLVGCHGQTVWHHDGGNSGPATLQLGDGDFVAEAAGCAVASDFRQRDVAAGGEGAPLVALVDPVLFARVPRPAALLNLGGMANLTLLGRDSSVAFDTGPAGSLLDGLARRLFGEAFDVDGRRAARGAVDPELLRELGAHPFFDRVPPKSTGRDTFGEAWLDQVEERARLRHTRPDDLLATAVECVAGTVADALRRFAPEAPAQLVVAGGGFHHLPLRAALERLTGVPVVASDAFGVPADAREALAFALLGAWAALGRPATTTAGPSPTGAAGGRVLGKLCAAPPSP